MIVFPHGIGKILPEVNHKGMLYCLSMRRCLMNNGRDFLTLSNDKVITRSMKGKNGVASSRILNLLFNEPNARSTVTLKEECL
jgi:hypothetical protein